MEPVYFFRGMDEPRSEPRDEGRTPKYWKPEEFYTLEQSQLARVDFQIVDGPVVQVPATLLKRANASYLGHESDLFPTPWPWEDRWVRNDAHFRRIPSQSERTDLYTLEERRAIEAEIRRLAAIENPGKCQERRRNIDGWCGNNRIAGSYACHLHTSKQKQKRIKKALAANEAMLQAAKLDLQKKRRQS